MIGYARVNKLPPQHNKINYIQISHPSVCPLLPGIHGLLLRNHHHDVLIIQSLSTSECCTRQRHIRLHWFWTYQHDRTAYPQEAEPEEVTSPRIRGAHVL